MIYLDDPDVAAEEPEEEDETSEDDEVKCPELTDCDVDSLGCEHGLKQDESGCDTCACHICGPICLMRCEHGFTMDERNCSQCRCVEGKFENLLLTNYVLTNHNSLVQKLERRNKSYGSIVYLNISSCEREFSNSFTIVFKYISVPKVTTEAVVTEEDDTNNVNNSVSQEEVDQNEEGSNKTVTYLTQSKKNSMNFFVFWFCKILDCFFPFLPSSDKKVIEVDPNAVQPEFLYDIQPINTQQQNDVQTEVDSTESEEDTEKECKSSN